MIVRPATRDDLPAIVGMSAKFYATTHYARFAAMDSGSVQALAETMIGTGTLLVAEHGGERRVEMILWEMAQLQHLQDSAALASIVEQQLRARVPMTPAAFQRKCIEPPRPRQKPWDSPRISASVRCNSACSSGATAARRSMPSGYK